MDLLGWDACDVILLTGDAYVDHPSFGMAIVGRVLEAQGFRVGIIAQPDWRSVDDFQALGPPTLYFGVTAGNMDSMVNRYTSDKKVRSDDAYTPGGEGGARPDRSVVVYSQRVREAYPDSNIVVGGIEASLRRVAHYDYWSEKVRRSVLLDAKADLLLYGNAERAVVDLAHRLAAGDDIHNIRDLRGTAFMGWPDRVDWIELDSSNIDDPQALTRDALKRTDPYQVPGADSIRGDADRSARDNSPTQTSCKGQSTKQSSNESKNKSSNGNNDARSNVAASMGSAVTVSVDRLVRGVDRHRNVVRIPSYEQIRDDAVLEAHASRILHMESNPGNARALVQAHGARDLWLNPPPIPLRTDELDRIYELPYQRVPHPLYGDAKIPAYEMIRFSIAIQRGCFGGCTFCSITEHEGRIIQSRSEDSIIREMETIRDTVPGFTGVVSDLGGPTANMYRLACKSRKIEAACRLPSCVYPGICSNLNTNHTPLIKLYRRARTLPGIKRVMIASGVRYDLAVESPEYVRELVTHHVGGYLKIAPEHISEGPLSKMMKPGIGTYDRFKELFDRYSKEAGKEQYLIPYFIAAHPGTTDEDMLELALWLKSNGYRADQVQAFLPGPLATATAMYRSGHNPLRKIKRDSEQLPVPKGARVRRLHKAFLRYHDANNWPMLRKALQRMGRAELIGNGKRHLIPTWQPAGTGNAPEGARRAMGSPSGNKSFRTQHTGLPHNPRARPRAGKSNKR
jgi:uncharacterized radical SAM protein YgiQ